MYGTLTRTNIKGKIWYSYINLMPWSRYDYLNTVSNNNNNNVLFLI